MKKILCWQINSFWLKLAYLLFLIVLLFPFYRISEPPSPGIDNSWRIALEMAYQKGLVFGKDIIYTYGPLGRLTQRIAIETSNFELFLFDIFCFTNVGFLLHHFFPKPLKFYHLLIHFGLFLLISSIYGEWLSFILFFISIFSGLLFLKKQNQWLLFHAIIMGVINFYIKANYGVIALGFVFMLLFYAFFSKRLSRLNLSLYLLGSIFLLVSLAFLLKTDLLAYFYSSVEIIKGYNESQSLFPTDRLRAVASSYVVFVLFLVLLIGFIVQKLKNKDFSLPTLDSFFVLGCAGVCSFVLLKYAFVRADDAHLMSFVRSACFPFLLIATFGNEKWLKQSGWILVSLNLLSYIIFYQPIYGKITFPIADNLRTKSYILPEYFKSIFKKTPPSYNPSYPKEILELIGDKTIDLVPNEVSEIYLNHLNYNPRPVVQSYQAYNEYLDNKNQEKYLSDTAPAFVIYSIENNDGKYSIGDETLTLLALLQRYEPVKIWDNHLLLSKKKVTKTLKLIKQTKHTWELGKTYPLNHSAQTKDMLCLLKVKTSYNWFGKLLNLFFQPPHLNMELTITNDKKTNYRTVPILLSKGLVVGSKIDNVLDAKQFFEQGFVENKGIESIRFNEILRKKTGFDNKIDIFEEWYELK
ncbi:hypothetical protein [Emticicia sp. SJ17W-69]|uniref:hypothetical protein n=1 Tax=Emticicia sp. SJ17W-69 TaxID=3421657 RepID=UPI003EBCC808